MRRRKPSTSSLANKSLIVKSQSSLLVSPRLLLKNKLPLQQTALMQLREEKVGVVATPVVVVAVAVLEEAVAAAGVVYVQAVLYVQF